MRGDHIDVREVSERDAVRNRTCETDQPIVAVIAADNAPGARVLPLDFGAAAPPAPVGLLRQEAPHGVGVQPAGIVVELVGRVMDHERRAYADRFGAMSDTDAIPYEPPDAGDELATLVGSLERQRRTFAWKCSGLDAAGTRAPPRGTARSIRAAGPSLARPAAHPHRPQRGVRTSRRPRRPHPRVRRRSRRRRPAALVPRRFSSTTKWRSSRRGRPNRLSP